MRALLAILAFCVLFVISAIPCNGKENCFKRLDKAKIIGDSLTVLTNDSLVIRGIHPMLNFTSSILYMRLAPDSISSGDIVIPMNTINRITYYKPSSLRHGPALLGLVVGVVAGGYAGNAISSDCTGWFCLKLDEAILGGVIGGILGLLIGHNISKNMTSKATLDCK